MENKDYKFQEFLKKITEQNTANLGLQTLAVKYEREISGEDNDKREKQLDSLIKLSEENNEIIKKFLKQIQESILGVEKGVKVLPKEISSTLSTLLTENKVEEKDKTLGEQLKEVVGETKSLFSSLGKGLSSIFNIGKGLLTSPRETFTSGAGKIKEKVRAAGSFVADVSSAEAGYTVEKERFAKEFAKQEKAKGSEVPEKELITQGKEKYKTIIEKEKELKTIEQSIGESKKQGFDPIIEDTTKRNKLIEDIKQVRGDVKSFTPVSTKETSTGKVSTKQVNPEADNLVTSQEILTDNFKSDLELTKENLNIQKEQLNELKKISQALVPKTPGELPEPVKQKQKEEEKGGGILDSISGLLSGGAGLGGIGKSIAGGAKTLGKGALSLGAGVAKFAGSAAGRTLGATAAVGLGAYTAYKGYTGAEDSKQAKLEEVQAKVNTGELTPEQAAEQREAIGNSATVEKAGAVGEGTGMAGGAIAGGLAGAKLGAAIGSIVPGAGTAIGAGIGTLAGGALGAFAGTKAGKYVGEKVGEGINTAGTFFGGIGDKVGEGINTAGTFFGGIGDKVKDTYGYIKKQAGLDLSGGKGKEQAEMLLSSYGAVDTKESSVGGKVTGSETQTQGITAEKSLFGSKFLGGLISKKGQETGQFLTTGSEYSEQDGKAGTSKIGNLLGKRISGGLFGKDRYSVSLEGKDGGAEYDTQFTKKDYMEIQNLAKEGKYDEAEAKYKELKAKQEEVNAAVAAPSSPEEVGVTQAKGLGIKEIGSKISEFFSFGKKKDKVTDFNQLSEEGKAYHKFKLQQSSADVIKGTDKNTFVDVDPVLKKKQEEAQKYGEELSKKINPAERKFVDEVFSNKSDPISAVKKGADVNARYKETEGQADVNARYKETEGQNLLKSSIENQDLQREATKSTPAVQPVVSSSVNTVNTTSYVPVKGSPRVGYSDSALDRYNNRVMNF